MHRNQRYMCYSCMIIRPGERDGRVSAEVEDSRRNFASSILRPPNCERTGDGQSTYVRHQLTLIWAITYLTHQNVVYCGHGKSCKTAKNSPRSHPILLRSGRCYRVRCQAP